MLPENWLFEAGRKADRLAVPRTGMLARISKKGSTPQ